MRIYYIITIKVKTNLILLLLIYFLMKEHNIENDFKKTLYVEHCI